MAPSGSSSASSATATTTSVQVALRIRPTTNHDLANIPSRFQKEVVHAVSPSSVSIESSPTSAAAVNATKDPKKQQFSFDQVHGPQTSQHAMFSNTALPLVSKFIQGFNCTILAYGQTSSGKTFTMTGIDLDSDPADATNGMGIVPRAVATIFNSASKLKQERAGAWTYSIKGSFIEIYNEDLLDLLDDPNMRREVQIREDKDGHIIWGGLREVPVKSTADVMNLIRKGTSIRRTNETDMNAQSSRSHAIFSLTLTQKKYVGGGPPPTPTSNRSSSRLARPGSVYAAPTSNSRVGSPTFGRPATPSFQAAMNRGGLRPSSALGHAGDKSFHTPTEDEPGEWVSVVSKFHFVDLAGSERLKRTAAAGERIKEGISINSGLLALGNVISALGDPSRAKSNTATHIPYRDSKLTRLLQDSLGGNAHTLMIACVSPAEYNAAETVNTLKYANRARNIKNRASINEKEDGWDDVEWLQGTVTRLRKEVKTLKDGGAIPSSGTGDPPEGASKKVLAQMTELQNNYEDLREKFVERTSELTRLRRELGEKSRLSGGSIGGTAKYEEIVGPVIEEYEKTISAMEAELNLNRAALRHTNEMVEEKEEELAQITDRHAATELYVDELKARVGKLSEREASTEAYIRDLEDRVKVYDESNTSSNESLGDLKREIAKFRESERSSSKYIADLEARLTRADESVLKLQQTVEKLEQESDRRREEAEQLRARLQELQTDSHSWRSDLEAREIRVKELEEKMEEWERKKRDAKEERERMGQVVEEVAKARRSLQVDLASSPTSGSPSPERSPSGSQERTALPAATEGVPLASSSVEAQFNELQQTHTATLADLSTMTDKYRDALREIADLAAQIQEAKLGESNVSASASTDSPPIGELDRSIDGHPTPTAPILSSRLRRRQHSRDTPSSANVAYSPVGSGSRRINFFRQAASMESLHSRSQSQSLSLSQELFSAHSRKTSFGSNGSAPGSSGSHGHSHSHSGSSQMSASSRPNLSISLPPASAPPNGTIDQMRTVQSLEKEIMRLQEVLRDREREISILEGREIDESTIPAPGSAATISASHMPSTPADSELVETPAEENNEQPHNGSHANGHMKAKGSLSVLSPETVRQFDKIRTSMGANGPSIAPSDATDDDRQESVFSETDENMERLTELMLSMAQKESQHREVVDDLTSQLTSIKKQFDDLSALSKNQALNMSSEMAALQVRFNEQSTDLQALHSHEQELNDLLEKEKALTTQLRLDHDEALKTHGADLDERIQRLQADHETALHSVQSELADASTKLDKALKDHDSAVVQLKADFEEELKKHQASAAASLSEAKEAHERAVAKVLSEQEELRRQEQAESSATQQRIEEEYYNALTKVRGDHAASIETLNLDHQSAIERLKEEHASALRQSDIAREGSLSESQSASSAAIQQLRDEHASALAKKEESLVQQIEKLKSEHLRALSVRDEDHSISMDKVRAEHESLVLRLREEARVEAEKLKNENASMRDELHDGLAKKQKESEAEADSLREQNAMVLGEMEKGHIAELEKVKNEHALSLKSAVDSAIAEAMANADKERDSLLQSHSVYVADLKAQHQQSITDVNNTIVAMQEEHRDSLEAVRAHADTTLAEEKVQFEAILDDLRGQQKAERELLLKDRDLIAKELADQKEKTTLSHDNYAKAMQELKQKSSFIVDLEAQLASAKAQVTKVQNDKSALEMDLEKTRTETSSLIQEASKRESLVLELERHRSVLADLQESLQRVKDEKDNLQTEKMKIESQLKDFREQISRVPSSPTSRATARTNGLPPVKLPPPTPPPSGPPPPAPKPGHVNADSVPSTSSQATSSVITVSSSKDSSLDSPATSIGPISSAGHIDPKLTTKIEAQAKQLEEQEAMIKTLNKQLTHCETDLQTHMDLVSTLETSLGDSEKNLRKARMHATELARERDSLNTKLSALQAELDQSRKEVASVRRSVVEEKQTLEQRLDEERRAKERARQQLDSRMDELQRRKSKFVCL